MESPFTDFVDIATETRGNNFQAAEELESISPFIDKLLGAQPGEQYFSRFEEENPEIFGEDFTYLENELTSTELKKAIEWNKKYAKDYQWKSYIHLIVPHIVGNPAQYSATAQDPEKFAIAFADWQDKNGFKTGLKGVFGLNSWTYFQKKLGFHTLHNQYGINTRKAVNDNQYYEKKIWGKEKAKIYQSLIDNKVLKHPLPLNDEYFAYAIADFQAFHGVTTDGILGPVTWKLITPGATTTGWHQVIQGATLSRDYRSWMEQKRWLLSQKLSIQQEKVILFTSWAG